MSALQRLGSAEDTLAAVDLDRAGRTAVITGASRGLGPLTVSA
jgi:hypothetical protein